MRAEAERNKKEGEDEYEQAGSLLDRERDEDILFD